MCAFINTTIVFGKLNLSQIIKILEGKKEVIYFHFCYVVERSHTLVTGVLNIFLNIQILPFIFSYLILIYVPLIINKIIFYNSKNITKK